MKYNKTSKKVGDFCIGFFGMGLVWMIIQNGILFLMQRMQASEKSSIAFVVAAMVFAYFLSIAYFWDNRRYIAIGILSQMILFLVGIGIFALILFNTGQL